MLNKNKILPIIKLSLKEDIFIGDITTTALINKNLKAKAKIIVKEKAIIAGLNIVKWTFQILDKTAKFTFFKKDGDIVYPDEVILEIEGKVRALLAGERTALNYLQRLSGIATLTRKYVDKVKNYKVKIFDTRKTVPLMRILDKYAVKVGGGYNHRIGLYDMVLIKDNHLKIVDSIENAIKKVKSKIPKKIKIEVEVENLEQVKAALKQKPDIIMLDNMDCKMIKKAVKLIKNKAIIEASGGINLSNITNIAKIGVNIISIGELTHSPKAIDINMKIININEKRI